MMTFYPFGGDPARRAAVLAVLPPLAGDGPLRALAGGADDPAKACKISNFPVTLIWLGEALAAAMPDHEVATFTLRFAATPAVEQDLADVAQDFITVAVNLAIASHRAGRLAQRLNLPPHADAAAVRNRAQHLAFDHGSVGMTRLIAALTSLDSDQPAAASMFAQRLLEELSGAYSSHRP